MSNKFALNIPFNVSRDYRKLLVVTYGLGLGSILWFDYPFWISVYLCIGTIVHGLHLFRIGKPHANYSSLLFQNNQWYLIEEIGRENRYQEMKIVYDFRWILYISLKQDKKKCHLLFFADQLTDEMRRKLYLLQLEQTASTTHTLIN